jgi:hypothetical protein
MSTTPNLTQYAVQFAASSQQSPVKTTKAGMFEALAQAWAQALDKQAATIQEKSDIVNAGDDRPSAITALTAESMRMQFLSNSSHTSMSSVSSALETMARKQ